MPTRCSKFKETMFSVIIPTMWYGKEFKSLLPLLENSSAIEEIIIINNDVKRTPGWFLNFDWKKVLTVSPSRNIYVNPAFNLGVKISKNNQIALIQDDVIFHPCIFEQMQKVLTPESGCFGADGGRLIDTTIFPLNLRESELNFEEVQFPKANWVENWLSVLMFFHKDNYSPIDENMKIHFGENWIIMSHFKKKLPVRLISSLTCWSSGSNQTTSKIENPDVEGCYDLSWIRKQINI